MGGLAILNAHRLAPAEIWAGVVLVDVTPRMELQGARRVVRFMAAHPDGFATLQDAGDVIAAYNPHRPRPERLDGLTKVLRQRGDGRWMWRWDPAFITSKLEVMQADPRGSAHQLDQTTERFLDGARRIVAPTLLVRRRAVRPCQQRNRRRVPRHGSTRSSRRRLGHRPHGRWR